MTLYENTGAPFSRPDGTRIESGGVFEPTAEELGRRRHKLRPLGPQVAEPQPPPLPESEPVVGWPLKMAPERYLQLHPDGPHAAQARTLAQPPVTSTPEAEHGDQNE